MPSPHQQSHAGLAFRGSQKNIFFFSDSPKHNLANFFSPSLISLHTHILGRITFQSHLFGGIPLPHQSRPPSFTQMLRLGPCPDVPLSSAGVSIQFLLDGKMPLVWRLSAFLTSDAPFSSQGSFSMYSWPDYLRYGFFPWRLTGAGPFGSRGTFFLRIEPDGEPFERSFSTLSSGGGGHGPKTPPPGLVIPAELRFPSPFNLFSVKR